MAPPDPPRLVSRVTVRGPSTVPEALVRVVLLTAPGSPLDLDLLGRDVRRIWALEAFDDVRVDLIPADEGQVEVVFELRERPLIHQVFVEGLAGTAVPPSLELLAGAVYQPALLGRALERLVTAQLARGHLLAGGEVRARPESPGRVDLCFVLRPGPAFTIERFEFVGNEQVPDRELEQGLRTSEGRVNAVGGVLRQDLLEADLQTLLARLYDRGLIDAQLGPPRVALDRERARASVEIPVQEGPVYRLGTVTVAGELRGSVEEALELFGLEPGEVFCRQRMVEGLERLGQAQRAPDRPGVIVEPAPEIDRGRRVVDLRLVVRAQ